MIAGLMAPLVWKLPNCLPKWLHHFALTPAMNQLHTSASIWRCWFPDLGPGNRFKVVFHCCFNLRFPNDMGCGASFHVLICDLSVF